MERSNNLSTRILTVFYRHPNDFISSMLVGNNIALVIYGILMAELIEHYILVNVLTNQAALVAIETIISTLIILVTGEFMPKTKPDTPCLLGTGLYLLCGTLPCQPFFFASVHGLSASDRHPPEQRSQQ